MHKLTCKEQNYVWGKIGNNSLVAQILATNGSQIQNKPYAEYWMGTHSNGPSYIANTDISLREFMKTNYNKTELPYLLKVLSINDPLSIQVHPDKEFAKILHQEYPNTYPDPNHKPELAIAVSDTFKLLYGLLPKIKAKERISIMIKNNCFENLKIQKIAENLITNDDYYKEFIFELISLDEHEIILKKIIGREFFDTEANELVKLLYNKFGLDKGILFGLFMNYYVMNKGQAIFITSNMPHAYIEGDCMECMANSDNVIRLGLTPKFVDVDNFKTILNFYFDSMIQESLKNIGELDNNIVSYSDINFKDFKLFRMDLEANTETEYYNINDSIMFILEGNTMISTIETSHSASKFECYYIANDINMKIKSNEKTIIFIATY